LNIKKLLITIVIVVVATICYSYISNPNIHYLFSKARQPTVTELEWFVIKDKTNENPYINGSYTCWDYSKDVIGNAQKYNYRAGFVFLDSKHVIVCFDTMKGIYYLEPQNDILFTQKQFNEMKRNETYCLSNFESAFSFDITIWR